MFRVEIPLPLRKRPWLSSNDRDHWGRRKSLSEYYRAAACQQCKDAIIPSFDMVTLDVALAFGDNRRRDAHNYGPTIKAIIDGIVDAGVLVDDSDKYVLATTIRRDENGPKGITVIIRGVVNASDSEGHGSEAEADERGDCLSDEDADSQREAA